MTIEEFAEAYNRTRDWNRDILDSIDKDMITRNVNLRQLVSVHLDTEKITPETHDYSDYEIDITKEYNKKLVFLTIHDFRFYQKVHYYVYPDKTEEEYKNDKIQTIRDLITAMSLSTDKKIELLMEEKSDYNEMLDQLLK